MSIFRDRSDRTVRFDLHVGNCEVVRMGSVANPAGFKHEGDTIAVVFRLREDPYLLVICGRLDGPAVHLVEHVAYVARLSE